MRKYILVRKQGCILSAYFEEDRVKQIDIEPFGEKRAALVGDVFVGKIRDLVPGIQAAFVEIADGEICYLPLEKCRQPVFLNPKKDEIPRQGDELVVQVSKEAVKTKPADVTANIEIAGRYAVLTHGKTMIGISGKIKEEAERKRLQELLKPYRNPEYGFILRTNAKTASDEEILAEIGSLVERYVKIRKKAEYASCFSCLSHNEEYFLAEIRDKSAGDGMEVITDDREIYQTVETYLQNSPSLPGVSLRFYEDPMISLWNLYGMEAKLEHALRKKVWLPCGGFLVIEPTEALTVIDVNSGKAVKQKKKEAAYFKVNQEAAKEIAAQIRLRNLSGILVVDFIDMEKKENTKELIRIFTEELKKDPIKTDFIDMTALHLAEITRKKVRKPLHEQIRAFREEKEGTLW